MKKFWIKTRNSLMAISLASFFSLAAAETILAQPNPLTQACADGFVLMDDKCQARFNHSEGNKVVSIPRDAGPVEIELIGAAGGLGGKDCGVGCTSAPSGPVGRVILRYSDLSNVPLKVFPGQAGSNGANGASRAGGGAGGYSGYNSKFDGGRGGNTGPTGSSGGGGGGGAATVILISNKEYVAAGGGGGGGSANSANGSTAGINDGKISTVSVAVNVSENATATFSPPQGLKFVSSKLRFESVSNPLCGKDISPNVAGSTKVTITASNESWGDSCVGVAKRVTGFLYYEKGSQGGDGLDSSCTFYCDGAGGGGGGGGVIGGAGGDLYQAPNSAREAAGFGGSSGTNSPLAGPVAASDYIDPQGDGTVTVRYQAKVPVTSVKFATLGTTKEGNLRLEVRAPASASIETTDIYLSGTVIQQTKYLVTQISKRIVGSEAIFTFNLRQLSNVAAKGTLDASVEGVSAGEIRIDQILPSATINLQASTLRSDTKVYDIKLTKPVVAVTLSDFQAIGTASGCKIGNLNGSNLNYQVSLTDCGDGTFGIELLANSIIDSLGNVGPSADILSELNESSAPAVIVEEIEGEIPKEILEVPVGSIFGNLDADTQKALQDLGIFAPMPDAPVAELVADLSTSQPEDTFNYESVQEITAGSTIALTVKVSPEIAATSDVVVFIKTGDLWQYLGRAAFVQTEVSADSFGIAKAGEYKIRIVVIAKNVVTNMSLPRAFGQSLPVRISRAVTDAETNLGGQQVNLTLNATAPASGEPEVVQELSPEPPPISDPGQELLDFELPSLNVGQPVANAAIGATGDDFGPSIPFDPLGSPESVAQVVKTTATAVAVVSTVAAAAAGAAAAGAAGSSSSSSSSSSNQNTNQEEGEIANIDAQVETFTSTHTGWGDRIPLFKYGLFTFLDKATHDLTLWLAKFSPVVSKIINDGAYLRAQLGSLWLAFPIAGIVLANMALAQPSIELSTPSWQLFIAIAVLGLFDALSGLLATVIFVIGMISTYGISSIADIRLMLGVIVMGFGPALISVAFRQIRKHADKSFSYFWERLVDIAVLVFFTGWTTAALVATLPALAGKTLSAANHVADFAFFLSIAIVIRILLEELAARSFAQRLDKINPTEVTQTSQLQKVISTMVRLGLFVFVTAAFMGNTWQVWVGSLIFILPNVFSWFEDKLPNSPLIWKIIPTGLPGLAFGLLVAGYSSVLIGSWIGDWPDFAQWSFLLLPIPMFIVGLIGLFGREGRDGEERPLQTPRFRYIYRLGGIAVLLLTAQLAGVI